MNQRNLSSQAKDLSATKSGQRTSVSDAQVREVKSFPAIDVIDNGALFSLSLRNHTHGLTHGIHRFAAKYIPQVPRWAIREFASDGDTVLDPFMGSGTTLVEGLQRCVTTIGVDIDPLARIVASAKTCVIPPDRIEHLAAQIRRRWTRAAGELQLPMSGIKNFAHWFTEPTWRDLQGLFQCIETLHCSDEERRLLFVLFSSILRWVSNADDQSQKTYVSGTRPKTPAPVEETFWRSVARAKKGMYELEGAVARSAGAVVLDDGDARKLPLDDCSVDLVVTSPPYLDSVDYMYNFMLEYFWLGRLFGISSREEFNQWRRKGIGTKSPGGMQKPLPASVADLVDTDEVNPQRLPAVVAYCNGMREHFQEAARVLKPNARYVLVIGNSQTASGILPVHDALVRFAAEFQLQIEKAFAYRIRRHYMKFPRKGRGGIILVDWVIVLRKKAKPVSFPARLPLPWLTLGADDVAH